MDDFVNLIELSQRPDASAAELDDALQRGEREVIAAEMAIADAEREYREGLLDSNSDAVKQRSEARGDAALRMDRAVALVAALKPRRAAALDRETEHARVVAYEQAVSRRDAAVAEIMRDVPKLQRLAHDLLSTIAEADAAVETANKALPAGAERLVTAEFQLYGRPARNRRDVSRKDRIFWAIAGRESPLDAYRQKDLADVAGNRTTIRFGSEMLGTPIVKRHFTEVKFYKESPAVMPQSLRGKTLAEISKGEPRETQVVEGDPSVELIPMEWTVHPFNDE